LMEKVWLWPQAWGEILRAGLRSLHCAAGESGLASTYWCVSMAHWSAARASSSTTSKPPTSHHTLGARRKALLECFPSVLIYSQGLTLCKLAKETGMFKPKFHKDRTKKGGFRSKGNNLIMTQRTLLVTQLLYVLSTPLNFYIRNSLTLSN
jgi:hypothetical protein